MHIRQLPATESAVERYVEDLWLPYHRDLEAVVERHNLTEDEDIDVVEEETEFRLDRLDSETHEVWVAIDAPAEEVVGADFAEIDATLAGYVTTEVDECPTVFEYPDRLVIGDIWVRESYRGTGLGRDLVEQAADRADYYDCPELRLDVDVDNERALAFYEKLGFEPYRYQMLLDVDAL